MFRLQSSLQDQEADVGVSELMKHFEDQEMEIEDKIENVRSVTKVKMSEPLRKKVPNFSPLKPKNENFDGNFIPLSEIDVSKFRRSDLNLIGYPFCPKSSCCISESSHGC